MFIEALHKLGIKLCLPRCPLLPSLCCLCQIAKEKGYSIASLQRHYFFFLLFSFHIGPHKLVVKQACRLHALVGFHLISLSNANHAALISSLRTGCVVSCASAPLPQQQTSCYTYVNITVHEIVMLLLFIQSNSVVKLPMEVKLMQEPFRSRLVHLRVERKAEIEQHVSCCFFLAPKGAVFLF